MTATETSIRELCDRFCTLWDQHDARGLASHYTADGVLADPFGNRAAGHAQLERLFRELHETAARQSTSRLTPRVVEPMSPDTVLVDAEQLVENMVGPDGSRIPEARFAAFMVLQRLDGAWRVRACRVFQPPAPPAG